MLDTTPEKLYEEVRAAEAFRDAHTAHMKDMVSEYHGPMFSDLKEHEGEYLPENHWHEYLSLVVPRVVFNNPRVRITSRRGGEGDLIAQAMGHALNRWIQDTKLRKTLLRVIVDMFFGYGVTLTTRGPGPAQTDIEGRVARWPNTKRLPPEHYFHDPLAMSQDEIRYKGHKWVADKADLAAQAKADPKTWNLGAIQKMAEGTGVRELGRQDGQSGLERGEVVVRDIWIPEYEWEDGDWKRLGLESKPTADDGFHGAIATLAVESSGMQTADLIRPLRPYYGPPSGPYSMFGVYYVPNSTFPLSPLVAVRGLVEELNQMARGISKSIQRYKRFLAADTEVADDLREIPHDNVKGIPGFEKLKAEQYEVGGVTEQMLAGASVFRDRLERNSGLNDAQRGNVSGEGTATENMIADEASSARMGFIQQQVNDCTAEMLQVPAYFFFYDDDAIVDIGEEMPGMVFQGGSHEEDGGETMEDMELEIEPYSMSRTSEGTQRARARLVMDVSTNVVPVMAQFPNACDWQKNLDDLGDSVNLPGFGQRFSPDGAAANLQAQTEQTQPGPEARYATASGQPGAGFQPRSVPGAKSENRAAGGPSQVGGGVAKAAAGA